MKNRIGLSALCLTLLLGAGVWFWFSQDNTGREKTGFLEAALAIPATEQRPGDPALGKAMLLSGSYASCGLPLRVVKQLQEFDPAQQLPGRVGPAAELPYYSNLYTDKNGIDVVASNCLSCHASELFGEVVIGLGNEFLDFTQAPSRQIERAGLLVRGAAEQQAWRRVADRLAAVAPYIQINTVGVNVANALTFALMAHRDPVSMEWSNTPVIDPPDTHVLPVSVPPWWRMSKKNAMFYQGQARGDHARFMMTAGILCADDLDDIRRADEYAADVRAYLASLKPPAYPFPIDDALAMQGQVVFKANCSGCHGVYEEPESYPNLLVPLDVIGTDPELALQAAVEYQRFAEWTSRSAFKDGTEIVSLQGYMPPPLDGIWATAPFLHNGSVPTVEALLNSSVRPQYWRYPDSKQYDQQALGWSFTRLEEGKESTDDPIRRSRIYDTTERGYGHQGHLFADTLSITERTAVIEYLKTL